MRKWLGRQWAKIKAWVIGLMIALGLAMPLALADTVTLSWTLPTQYEDGTPLPAAEIAEVGISKQSFPLGTAIGSEPRVYVELVRVPGDRTGYLDEDQDNGIHCYVAWVVATNGARSVDSNESCKTVDVRVPGAISNMTAQ